MVRIPGALSARVDQLRGDVPRERYIRRLLERAVEAEERNVDGRQP